MLQIFPNAFILKKKSQFRSGPGLSTESRVPNNYITESPISNIAQVFKNTMSHKYSGLFSRRDYPNIYVSCQALVLLFKDVIYPKYNYMIAPLSEIRLQETETRKDQSHFHYLWLVVRHHAKSYFHTNSFFIGTKWANMW